MFRLRARSFGILETTKMSASMAALFHLGNGFAFDGSGPLMHWSWSAAAAGLYLAACALHNARRDRSRRATEEVASRPWTLLDSAAVVHNCILVVFSMVVFVLASAHAGDAVAARGLHSFLCPPPPAPGSVSPPAPLHGPLHFWCYVFYLSKYYEMLDTMLLVLSGKPVIALHAFHHAFMPLVMWALFYGGVSVSLVGLAVLNSLVHVVMYSYYLASALRRSPPLWWKRRITQVQILQFSVGAIGGTYYWVMYFKDVALLYEGGWPRLTYSEGCAGGEPLMVLVGYSMNLVLLALFLSFYRRAYRSTRSKAKAQ